MRYSLYSHFVLNNDRIYTVRRNAVTRAGILSSDRIKLVLKVGGRYLVVAASIQHAHEQLSVADQQTYPLSRYATHSGINALGRKIFPYKWPQAPHRSNPGALVCNICILFAI